MTRFTLQPRTWYAMQLLGDEFDDSRKTFIRNVTPLMTGQGMFDLEFSGLAPFLWLV